MRSPGSLESERLVHQSPLNTEVDDSSHPEATQPASEGGAYTWLWALLGILSLVWLKLDRFQRTDYKDPHPCLMYFCKLEKQNSGLEVGRV